MQLTAKITKADDEQRLVFGFASVADIEDSDGDIIDIYELERAAHRFVADGGTAGVMHEKLGIGELVESVVFTPEKIAALNMPEDTPQGWFVGFHVTDDAVWQAVKAGELRMFSIGGRATRRENSDD